MKWHFYIFCFVFFFGELSQAHIKGKDLSDKEKAWDLLLQNPKLILSELAKELGIPTSSANKLIQTLKDEGRLVHVGTGINGYWQILQEQN